RPGASFPGAATAAASLACFSLDVPALRRASARSFGSDIFSRGGRALVEAAAFAAGAVAADGLPGEPAGAAPAAPPRAAASFSLSVKGRPGEGAGGGTGAAAGSLGGD